MHRIYPLLSLALFCLFAGGALADSYPLQGIEDGDTLQVRVDGHSESIQLRGIDAPENTPNPKLRSDLGRTGLSKEELLELGRLARQHLQTLLTIGQPVELSNDMSKRDRYGRVLEWVSDTKGRNINETMLADGYAIALPQSAGDPKRGALLLRLEQEARASGRGLWGEQRQRTLRWSGARP